MVDNDQSLNLNNEIEEVEKLKANYNKLVEGVEKMNSDINHLKLGAAKMSLETKRIKIEIESLNIKFNTKLSRITQRTAGEGRTPSREVVYESMADLFKVDFYTIGKYVFDVKKRVLIFEGVDVSDRLTTKSAHLLVLFAANINKLLSREEILVTVWDIANYSNSRSMDVYMTRLRVFLSKDTDVSLYNYHGKGFKLIVI